MSQSDHCVIVEVDRASSRSFEWVFITNLGSVATVRSGPVWVQSDISPGIKSVRSRTGPEFDWSMQSGLSRPLGLLGLPILGMA